MVAKIAVEIWLNKDFKVNAFFAAIFGDASVLLSAPSLLNHFRNGVSGCFRSTFR